MPKPSDRRIVIIKDINDIFNIHTNVGLKIKTGEFHNLDVWDDIARDISKLLYLCSLFFVLYMDAIKENVESRVKKLNIDQPSAQKTQRFKLTTSEKKSIYFSWKGNKTREEAFNEYKMATINQITNAKKGKRITDTQERKFKKQFISILKDIKWEGLQKNPYIKTSKGAGYPDKDIDIRYKKQNIGGLARDLNGVHRIWEITADMKPFAVMFDTLYNILLPNFELLKWLNKIYFQFENIKTWDKVKLSDAGSNSNEKLTLNKHIEKSTYLSGGEQVPIFHPSKLAMRQINNLIYLTIAKHKPIAKQVAGYWEEVQSLNKKELDDLINSELELKSVKDAVEGLISGVEIQSAIEEQEKKENKEETKALNTLIKNEKNIQLTETPAPPKEEFKIGDIVEYRATKTGQFGTPAWKVVKIVGKKQLKIHNIGTTGPPMTVIKSNVRLAKPLTKTKEIVKEIKKPVETPAPPKKKEKEDRRNIDEFPAPRIDKAGNRIYKIMSRLFFGDDPKSKGGYPIKKEMTLLDTMNLIDKKGYYISPAQKKKIMNNNDIGLGEELATKYDKNTFEIYKKSTGKTDRLYLVKLKHTDRHGRQTDTSMKQDDAIDKIVMKKKS